MVENHIETVEEKIRNKVTPIVNVLSIITETINEYTDTTIDPYVLMEVLRDYKHIIDTCNDNIKSLIEIGNIVDKHLSKDFSINKELKNEKED